MIDGRYELGRELGRGGMGIVWEAEDTVLRRQVAVKQLRMPDGVEAGDERALKERFLREARSAAALDHPSVISVYDVSEAADGPWMVMQLVRGRSLHAVVQEDGPLPPAEVARIGLALLDALDCAHAEGIVHRDVKPGNVLLADGGRVVLTDFGIAAVRDATAMTRTGIVIGTPGFIAPERAVGRPAGPPSDLWALGATLCVAVEGELVDQASLQRAGALGPVIKGLLTDDPVERWTSARARRHLQSAAGPGEPRTPTRLDTGTMHLQPGGEPRQPAGRGRVPLIAVVAGALAGAVVAGLAVALPALGGDDDGGPPDDNKSPVAKAKAAAVPELCEPLGKHPDLDEWVPNHKTVPTAARTRASVHCGFVGRETFKDTPDEDTQLTVAVVGHTSSKAARTKARAQAKAGGLSHTTDSTRLGDESWDGFDDGDAVLFRVGPFVARATCSDTFAEVCDVTALQTAEWVETQLKTAAAG